MFWTRFITIQKYLTIYYIYNNLLIFVQKLENMLFKRFKYNGNYWNETICGLNWKEFCEEYSSDDWFKLVEDIKNRWRKKYPPLPDSQKDATADTPLMKFESWLLENGFTMTDYSKLNNYHPSGRNYEGRGLEILCRKGGTISTKGVKVSFDFEFFCNGNIYPFPVKDFDNYINNLDEQKTTYDIFQDKLNERNQLYTNRGQ